MGSALMDPIPDSTRSSSSKRFRISLATLLLWFALVGLLVSNLLLSHRLSVVEHEWQSRKQELETIRPLPLAEVARQFEARTTRGPISVSVKDVRYSADKDSYKIYFSWTDSSSNKTWSTDVELKSDGYGSYYGQIRNGPFIQPLGYKESFTVVVITPSSMSK
jgi:hypothetical protein